MRELGAVLTYLRFNYGFPTLPSCFTSILFDIHLMMGFHIWVKTAPRGNLFQTLPIKDNGMSWSDLGRCYDHTNNTIYLSV